MITIKGILSSLTYQNPDNHYTVARLKLPNISDPVTIVGHLAGILEGESLEVQGTWGAHPKYGDQFKVTLYKVILPATTSGIRKYLGSGMIKGIGQALADKIVDHFGEATLDVIENEPHRLKEIPGIGKGKKRLIVHAWNTHHAVRRVMQFLQENQVSVQHTAVILKTYGESALSILQSNPYQMAVELNDIGFSVADRIARNNGFEPEDPNRLQAALIHSLILLEQEGHTFGLLSKLISDAARLTGVSQEKFHSPLEDLAQNNQIRRICRPEDDQIYLDHLFSAEKAIAERLLAMQSMPAPTLDVEEDDIVEQVLSRMAVKLSEEQVDVVSQVLKEKVVVITGGPGTGKTTLICALCEVFHTRHRRITLGAPTGRAARRLSQVTGKKAATLHKLLGFDHDNQTFEFHANNPLDTDLFIVDEASMIDTLLMHRLLEATPFSASLIIVGDTFQLPSVGPGNVLADIIASEKVRVFSLTRIFRQAAQSPIVSYAHTIRNGEMPVFEKTVAGELSEFYFIENARPEKVVETITELCARRIPKAFPQIDDVQVLTPMHRGEAGTINLNHHLQARLNPDKKGITSGGVTFRPSDKVMHLKNNYEKEVFNGDIGVVMDVLVSKNQVLVDFDGRVVEYDILELDELSLAYAISVHKSQGSEYGAVIIALTTAHYPLLQRNLLYTALTRGKRLVILVGSSRAVEMALQNTRTTLRQTGLKTRLEKK